jgi:hypothetical protein
MPHVTYFLHECDRRCADLLDMQSGLIELVVDGDVVWRDALTQRFGSWPAAVDWFFQVDLSGLRPIDRIAGGEREAVRSLSLAAA